MVRQILNLCRVRRDVSDNLSIICHRTVRPVDVRETSQYLAMVSGTVDWSGQETVIQARAWMLREHRNLYRLPG